MVSVGTAIIPPALRMLFISSNLPNASVWWNKLMLVTNTCVIGGDFTFNTQKFAFHFMWIKFEQLPKSRVHMKLPFEISLILIEMRIY